MPKIERSVISVVAFIFRSWGCGQSASSPDVPLRRRGRALSGPVPTPWSNYFLTFAFLARAADP